MYDHTSLLIDLNGDIGATPQLFEFVLDDDFFAEQVMSDKLQGGRVEVRVAIKQVGAAFHLEWQAEGTVKVPCDLCLDEVVVPVDVSANYLVEFGAEADETEHSIVLAEGEHELDLGFYVCESLVLGLPITNKHNDGACNAEMTATLREYLAKENSRAEEEEWN